MGKKAVEVEDLDFEEEAPKKPKVKESFVIARYDAAKALALANADSDNQDIAFMASCFNAILSGTKHIATTDVACHCGVAHDDEEPDECEVAHMSEEEEVDEVDEDEDEEEDSDEEEDEDSDEDEDEDEEEDDDDE